MVPLQRLLKALLISTSEPLTVREIQMLVKRFHQERSVSLEEKEREGTAASEEDQAPQQGLASSIPSSLTTAQIQAALDTMGTKLEADEEVYRLTQGPGGYYLTTAPEFCEWVRLLRKEPRPKRLSKAALETLAIIAYRQPTTRAAIEWIRGVKADSALNTLLEHDLIAVIGHADLPGRPLQYGTTETFLTFIGIQSIEALPASTIISPEAIDALGAAIK